MWSKQILHTNFFNIFYFFIIYSVLGWLMETTLVSYSSKKFVNRGFLSSPLCPIYGIGGSLVYLLLTPYENNYAIVFLGGMTIATVVEYLIATVMENLFHAKWWDYSDRKYNIKGRVCISISVAWGFLSIVLLKIIQPLLISLVDIIPLSQGIVLAYAFLTFLAIDLITTVSTVLKLNNNLTSISQIKSEALNMFENSKLHDSIEKFKLWFEENGEVEFKFALSEKINEEIEKWNEKHEEGGFELKQMIEDLYNDVNNFKNRYIDLIKKQNYVSRRLLKAYPNIRSLKNDNTLKELKLKLDYYKLQKNEEKRKLKEKLKLDKDKSKKKVGLVKKKGTNK